MNECLQQMTYKALDIQTKWPKTHRPWNRRLIPQRLIELAKAGTYYDSKVLPAVQTVKKTLWAALP